jgi:flagellar export protein FliJ
MNLAMLRAYAVQLEEIAKLELADLSQVLQRSIERMAMLESRAQTDANLYLDQVRGGSTVTQVYAQFEAMDQAIAARKKMEQAHASQQGQVSAKRNELIEAMQYRKKLDLLRARSVQEQRHRQEKQDQQLLDERAWRRHSSVTRTRP